MVDIQENHFKLSIRFAKFLGLWPTQNDKTRKVGLVLFIVLNASFIIPEVFICLIS